MKIYLHYRSGRYQEVTSFYTFCHDLLNYDVDSISLHFNGELVKTFILDVEEG